ncbi:hypothetical protein [Posidoniimonas polymericola]|uniref:hypothetical protein n=1 Tax=Posidoniimonas polymericola TaxID=2528002 RepID=UPI0011B60721|nr:hypothetical protein [Posidoniimonas polymericola]
MLTLLVGNAVAGTEYGGAPGLTQGLDDLLTPPPAADQRQAPPRNPGLVPDRQVLDKLLQDNLDGKPQAPIVGEDVGKPGEDPLARVQESMGQASELIDRLDQGTKEVQEQIVSDLDVLIAKMEKQCQGGQCNNPKPNDSQQSKRSQPKPSQQSESKPKPGEPKPGQGKPSQSTAQNAAGDSTKRLDSSAGEAASGRSSEELMKEVWGHLPQRLREQMMQGSSDEFLPQYREEIERYYQRLAEEEAGR